MDARRGGGAALGGMLFAALAVLVLVAFAVTRAARAGDDLVNTVELQGTLPSGGEASVAFTLAEPDQAVDVLIIDGEREQVRALELGVALDAGPQEFSWDGVTDDGQRAPPGLYAIRVILGEAERDILPPGRIRVGSSDPALGGEPGE